MLFGRHHPQPRFPLLVKLLDAHRRLSLQVHPDDARAARLVPLDLGKTEAWVVLAAEPGSVIYAGLKRGFDRHALEREVVRGTAELCLHKFEPRAGDCVFLPAGALHALGEGLVVAEIQQSSDVTYRLFDWNRMGVDGKPRALHVEQALQAIDFRLGPIDPVTPTAGETAGVDRLVECEKFVLERWRLDGMRSTGGDDRCRVLMVLEGAIEVAETPPATRGTTLLLPAGLGAVEVRTCPAATVLCAYLP
jgi:mannose-6-phosphate isomerase